MSKTRPLDSVQKEQKKINEYNTGCHVIDDDVKNVSLLGPRILVRPYRLSTSTKSGLFKPMKGTVVGESGRANAVDNPYPYQEKGVIVNISEECPKEFTDRVKVGDVVMFPLPININTEMFSPMHIQKIADMTFSIDTDNRRSDFDMWHVKMSYTQILAVCKE